MFNLFKSEEEKYEKTRAEKALEYLGELQSLPSKESLIDYLEENNIDEFYFLTCILNQFSELPIFNDKQKEYFRSGKGRFIVFNYYFWKCLSPKELDDVENILYPVEQNNASQIVEDTIQSVSQIY